MIDRMSRRIKSLKDVVEWGLCVGCGACLSYCDHEAVSLVNIESVGIRPKFVKNTCNDCSDCLSFCPGYHLDTGLASASGENQDLLIGPTLEIWEGYAADPEIRFRGSSGGVLTALSVYCLEKESMEAVLHTGADPDKPWLNKTVQSRNRKELLEQAGSRYAPASPCEGLGAIEAGTGSWVFIGKPCDTAAMNSLRKLRPDLDRKTGLVLTFFCAGPPSTQATENLIRKLGVDLDRVKILRYRGHGWPGDFYVSSGADGISNSLNYKESWGYLAGHPRSFRCHLCPDGLGEIADISCGDAWHRYNADNSHGLSLVLIRTERGREVFNNAVKSGYIKAYSSNTANIIAAQELVRRRQELFGRLLAMRLLLIPTPKYVGFLLFKEWMKNPIVTKNKTILGTLRRLLQRGLWHRNPLE